MTKKKPPQTQLGKHKEAYHEWMIFTQSYKLAPTKECLTHVLKIRNERSINSMGGMMDGMMGGFGGGFGLIGLLLNLVVIVGIVVLVIWAVRQFSSNGQKSGLFGQQNNRTSQATPPEIAAERYARGEITREQYQEMLSDLS